MTADEVLQAIAAGEDEDWEFKSAQGGVPGDLWETYSAMANTGGGVIVLGVKQSGPTWELVGVPDPARYRKLIFDGANNRSTISHNLLTNQTVTEMEVEGKHVIVLQIPAADATRRPVYRGPDVFKGTYRRYDEGDYLCTPDQVRRMLADQLPDGHDTKVLEHFGLGDLDTTSVDEYRNRFSAARPGHAWLSLDPLDFLSKIGAYGKDRESGVEGLTVAGLLLLGRDEAIRDRLAVPEFAVDYREHLSDDPSVRWTDRLEPDGTWAANLFQFCERAYRKLVSDLKVPFRLEVQRNMLTRAGESTTHEAIREALVNALVHADHRGQGGVIVERRRDRLVFSNPGTLLVPVRQILRGGLSVCRNKAIQTMFRLIGYGETAGSGWDRIRSGWREQMWRDPQITESPSPDRVSVTMPMVSLLPDEAVQSLRERFGGVYDSLRPEEVQALVTAEVEGEVSNARMQQLCEEHRTDITKLLTRLVSRDLLVPEGRTKGRTYRLSDLGEETDDSTGLRDDSTGLPDDSTGLLDDTTGLLADDAMDSVGEGSLTPEQSVQLTALAEPARSSRKLPQAAMRRLILKLCEGRHLTVRQLAELVERNRVALRDGHINPMLDEGLLARSHPDKPHSRHQAYTATEVGLRWRAEQDGEDQ